MPISIQNFLKDTPMTSILRASLLSIATAVTATFTTTAGAVDWPWQTATPTEPLQYCKGFVAGGLDSTLISGMSRTELWLAWSYVIRADITATQGTAVATDNTAIDGSTTNVATTELASNEYQSGVAQFSTLANATSAETILHDKTGDCGIGRSGHQITGW
jgi:hypothetical protein